MIAAGSWVMYLAGRVLLYLGDTPTKEFPMARYEFRFVITDTELSDEHQQKVGQAVAEAGALAVAGITPPDAVTVKFGINQWWRGIPPREIHEALEEVAVLKAGPELIQ